MSMPGPMARGAELAMNWGGGQIMRVLRGPDGTALATRMPSSPEELIQNVQDTARYVQSLSPEHAQEYAQRVGDIALQVIEDAGAQAQTTPSSSVTITEIDDIADIEETNDAAALAAASASPEQRSPAHAHRSPDQAATSTAPSS
ncbi:hypothetical protein XPN_4679 [Xanthomonas arboricola pv. pruni MAFF 301427]|nr:hypothetical protein XPN_4679 [Xanthomonas arboricola pv. pruni MAFF 301427]